MASPYTITATLLDPGNNELTNSTTAFVRFRLRNFQGYVPQVQTNGVLCEIIIDAFPNSSGAISQTIWGNNQITPSNTFYTVEQWSQGRCVSSGNYIFDGNTNLDTASQVNAPPAPPGFSMVLENNGALNSSQTLLNLENTDGSVTITDEGSGTLNITASTSSFSVATLGGFYGPGVPLANVLYDQASIANGAIGTTNQIQVRQFTLDYSITIRKVSFYVGAVHGSGSTGNVGIYSSAGNLLLDSGNFNLSSSNGAQTNTLATPVTLSPGVYYFAQGTNDGGFTGAVSFEAPSSVQIDAADLANISTVRYGSATNTYNGALPPTLGALTASLNYDTVAAFFEP